MLELILGSCISIYTTICFMRYQRFDDLRYQFVRTLYDKFDQNGWHPQIYSIRNEMFSLGHKSLQVIMLRDKADSLRLEMFNPAAATPLADRLQTYLDLRKAIDKIQTISPNWGVIFFGRRVGIWIFDTTIITSRWLKRILCEYRFIITGEEIYLTWELWKYGHPFAE